jgi:hypothetical protein
MWYKKLSQVIKQGIEDCADEREIQYLEQCKEKCLKEIKILKKIEIEVKDDDELGRINAELDKMKKI